MVRSTFQKKSSNLSAPCGFFHAKSRTRIGCWNVHSLGFLSDQGAELCSVIHTMKTKDIDLLVLFESRWPGRGVCTICSTTILHSGTMSSCTHPWCGCLPLSSSKGCLGGFWQFLPALCLGGLANWSQSAICPTWLSCPCMLPPILPPLRLFMTNYKLHLPVSLRPIYWLLWVTRFMCRFLQHLLELSHWSSQHWRV